MCDYSLHGVENRPAKVGDKLISTRFTNSDTCGFAATGEPDVAVCLLPGTEVAFEEEVECDNFLWVFLSRFRSRKPGLKMARFRQVNVEKAYVHHDALEFSNGQIILVTHLREGQRATVLQLPVSHAAEKVKRLEHAKASAVSTRAGVHKIKTE
jgi:hypothetical protein